MKETTLTGESKDILNENIETLKELFPEIVSEDKIDFDKFKTIFGGEIDDSSERYSFTWPGKIHAIKESQKQSTGTLRPCKEESKNWNTTKNLYIEGDNLEVLKLLQKEYFKKIKAIYIDPPYNTGKDFVYRDNYKDNLENYLEITGQVSRNEERTVKISTNAETQGMYHSNWLNMMYPRLKLAKNLLTDDGAIFISIDDNEVTNLKRLCDEIFGQDNFLSMNTVIVKTEGRRYGFFAKTHEYLLVYAKNNDFIDLNEIEIEGKTFSYTDEKGGYNLKELRNGNTKAFNSTNRPNLRYPFYVDLSTKDKDGFCELEVDYKDGYEEVWPIEVENLQSVWRWGKEKSKNEKDDLIARVGKDGIIRIFQKTRKLTQTAKTLWQDKSFISNKGTHEVRELLGNNIFDFPKPLGLIDRVIQIGTNEDSYVLDLFSGSGTTAHSVLKINDSNKGNRKFIMVQIPEPVDENSYAFKAGYKNICEIGKERIRRAGDKIVQESGNNHLDIGFKVFKLDSSNLNKWDPDYDNLEQTLLVSQDNIKPDRTQEDLIYEIMLKYGIDLTLPIEEYDAGKNKIYSIGFGALLICLDNKITKDIADSIIELASEDVCRVVFKDNGFASDADKTNIKETLRTHGIDEFITI